MTLEDGKYKSLEYTMIDTLTALERSHPALVDDVRRKVGTPDQPWTVEVTYADFGASVTVSAPPPERVIDLGDPDELMALSPDERPTGTPPTCEAQR